MNNNFMKSIYKFNKDRDLLEAGYDDKRECAYPIEEALEGLNDLDFLAGEISLSEKTTPKNISREIVRLATKEDVNLSTVDRLDKHIDTIVFALGSIYKLGLSPQQAEKAINIVCEANARKSNKKDSEGKVIKGDNFKAPEDWLQDFLDKEGIK